MGEEVAFGDRISDEQWETTRDFAVFILIGGRSCCSGTIQGNAALTAAHCVDDADPSDVQIRTWKGPLRVTRIELHPTMDVALLFLADTLEPNTQVFLPRTRLDSDDQAQLAGFGVTEDSGCGDLYDTGLVDIIDCNRGFDVACAASGRGSRVSSCGGDSGGSWYKTSQSAYFIVGVNSFGFDGGCGDIDKKTGFARVSSLEEWMQLFTTPFRFADLS